MANASFRSGKDRRQINTGAVKERRGKAPDRRRCPKCRSKLATGLRRVEGGSVTTVRCTKCDWSRSSRQTDLTVLMAKLTYLLRLERTRAGFNLPFPDELIQPLGLRAGDEFVLKPLTSPLGSQPMKWALEVAPRKR